MLDAKVQTLLTVARCQNFTRAAEELSLTQPGISHHIRQLEQELDAPLFSRGKSGIKLTPQGEIAVKYATRMQALERKMHREMQDLQKQHITLRVGLTHTSESNLTMEVLAKCCNQHRGLNITVVTDTIKNLYDMLGNYEIDLAIVESPAINPCFSSMMLDTDYLVCVMANTHRLARHAAVTLAELKREQMILRLPSSATRSLFESALESNNDSIDNFDVSLEVDNIATIKDLIRKELGVSILPRSACMDELRKGKITALPVENLSMLRETRIVYNRDFSATEILHEIIEVYQKSRG